MVKYKIVAVCSHEALKRAVEVINELGYNDIVNIMLYVPIGELTVKTELNEEQIKNIIDFYMERRELLESLFGLDIKEIRLIQKV